MAEPKYRIGTGYDVHALISGRKLMIGGVQIDFDRGLDGHSDADVLIHAVCDALLGAAGLGDIGEHFPDSDPAYKGIASLVLLEKCGRMIRQEGFTVCNMDCILMAQVPKISPYKARMKKKISAALDIPASNINIKATTTEKLGFIGKEQGMAAQCTVLLTTSQEQ